jgi:hypothetical protein
VERVGCGLARDERGLADCSAAPTPAFRCALVFPLDDSFADGSAPADSAGYSSVVSRDDSFPGDCLVEAALADSALSPAAGLSPDGCSAARWADDLAQDDRSVPAVGWDGSRPADLAGS